MCPCKTLAVKVSWKYFGLSHDLISEVESRKCVVIHVLHVSYALGKNSMDLLQHLYHEDWQAPLY